MLTAFQDSFQNATDDHPYDPERVRAVYALLRLALITTAVDIA